MGETVGGNGCGRGELRRLELEGRGEVRCERTVVEGKLGLDLNHSLVNLITDCVI